MYLVKFLTGRDRLWTAVYERWRDTSQSRKLSLPFMQAEQQQTIYYSD